MNLKWIITLFFATLISCDLYEPLVLKREDFNGNNLKTDGYYYKKQQYGEGYDVFFIYKNGVYFETGSNEKSNDLNLIDKGVSATIKVAARDTRYFWGLFKVNGGNIEIEKWLSTAGSKYPTQSIKGEILNDSTILFTSKIGDDKFTKKEKPVLKINELYRFRRFFPKPDSTNKFIN